MGKCEKCWYTTYGLEFPVTPCQQQWCDQVEEEASNETNLS